jgi:hypothetical protein
MSGHQVKRLKYNHDLHVPVYSLLVELQYCAQVLPCLSEALLAQLGAGERSRRCTPSAIRSKPRLPTCRHRCHAKYLQRRQHCMQRPGGSALIRPRDHTCAAHASRRETRRIQARGLFTPVRQPGILRFVPLRYGCQTR